MTSKRTRSWGSGGYGSDTGQAFQVGPGNDIVGEKPAVAHLTTGAYPLYDPPMPRRPLHGIRIVDLTLERGELTGRLLERVTSLGSPPKLKARTSRSRSNKQNTEDNASQHIGISR